MHQLTKLGPDTLRSGSLNERAAVPERSVAQFRGSWALGKNRGSWALGKNYHLSVCSHGRMH